MNFFNNISILYCPHFVELKIRFSENHYSCHQKYLILEPSFELCIACNCMYGNLATQNKKLNFYVRTYHDGRFICK